MLEIGSIVWGVRDINNFPRLIEFWCKALNYKPAREPDTDWAILIPKSGTGQQMALSVVTSTTVKRQRHHLDLYASDQKAEIDRLLSLGATLAERDYPDGADYVVLEDPDGNAFCVIDKGS
ncbi:glyoxalase-like domain-containing protein [Pochonia chlamydosporia 170]|uniref:Glyoxalase-like domain-containing protein n=1 Tax=Pochonia chlamydosporia 170 TaxID=1380566 RepID=A0A179F3U1_METCM|nr:glyoxalase-like domain-containing protein [Pochonia chlamydosporia 170]OAQ59853.1 glyoxalase-like domain-containing protein [Pochonia chlamydosporia 170]